MTRNVKLIHAAIDETAQGEIIFRGVLDNSTLHNIQTGSYQREILPLATLRRLVEAYKSGSVPDITLGMRGADYDDKNGVVTLKDDTYVIDGLQRITAALQLISEGGVPHVGVAIHFNTTEEWEREHFRILNAERIKLSPNVLLRNTRWDHPGVETLFILSKETPKFVMNGRVSWDQRMNRQELISALTFGQVAAVLHVHLGVLQAKRVADVARAMDEIQQISGPRALQHNVTAFYDLLDECFGIRKIAYKVGASHMKGTFLHTLARVLSLHEDFWRDKKLFVEAPLKNKIAQFPVNDTTVSSLSSAGGKAGEMLYHLMVDHINSGKRTHRLTTRRMSEETASMSE